MKNVLLRGPACSLSGYGTHARQIARWLFRVAAEQHQLDITTELMGWGQTHWITDTHAEDGLVGEILQASLNSKPFYDVTIQVQLPNEWNPLLGMFNVGVTAGVETDRCNPTWIPAINSMSLVIVPSEFTKTTLLASGKVDTPIIVVPEAFPDNLLSNPDKVLDLSKLSSSFNFLVFGQFTGTNVENDRKNIPYTLKWIAEEFAGQPDVGVVLKTNLGAMTRLDRASVYNLYGRLLEEIKVSPGGPRFHLLHGMMTTEEIGGLLRHPKIKAMVSLTRGEGFGIPLLEAAVCDLPVIATNWSGHSEFLNQGKWIKFDSKLGPIHQTRVDNSIFMPGAQWAVLDEKDVKTKLRKFYEANSIPKQWAVELGTKLRDSHSFESVARQLSAALGSYL